MIELKVGNIFTYILGDVPNDLYKEIERKLSFRPENYQFRPAFNRTIRNAEGKVVYRAWDGWQKCCWKTKKHTYFPTGLLSILVEFLQNKKIPFKRTDTRSKPESNIILAPDESIVYRDYQNDAINVACERTRGIIQSPTGSGKTIIASGIVNNLGVAPFIVFVTSIDLLTQTKDAFEASLRKNGKKIKVGQIGGGVVDIQDINVMTVQTAVRALGYNWDKNTKFDNEDTDDKTNIEKHKKEIAELIKECKGSISDEVQRWRADTCRKVAKAMKNAYYTYGVSATPYRDSGDDMLIQSCFGKVIYSISASELIRQGWLVPPHIKMVYLRQPLSSYRQWQSIYKEQVVENSQYNSIIINIARKFVSDGRVVLILSQQIDHGKSIAKQIEGAVYLSGKSPKKKRQKGLDDLRNHKISCISSSSIFDEGIDVRALNTLILAGQGRSKVRAMQRVGRTMRPYEYPDGTKKTKSVVVDFCLANQKYLKNHAKQRLKMYREEPEFVIEELEAGI